MSAEVMAVISVAMLGFGAVAILTIMIGLTYNVIREGWLSGAVTARSPRPEARPAARAQTQTQPMRKVAA